ncbi:MAG TPA: deoxycytidylate deaminase [Alphaproteobacteria bacterium]|nr:deoxycytidylate deaminase [Alphaproteobacteria bacterium]
MNEIPENSFHAMQSAVDIVLSSPHPENKVAACLFSQTTTLAKTNDWPQRILDNLGEQIRIGNSSGTVHAEVNCLLHFPEKTQGTEIAITDPCCPNCAKCISESGIKTVYIDHKGFAKDFATRRGDEFKDMSLSIMAHAGINIYEINRKEKTISVIHQSKENYTPPEDNPIKIVEQEQLPTEKNFLALIHAVKIKHASWGCAFARDKNGKIYSLVASTHAAIGYSQECFEKNGEPTPDTQRNKKYSFYINPLNRLLFGAAKHGLKIMDDYIWTSTIPTSREMVNLIGAGYTKLAIGNITISEEKSEKLSALKTLQNSKTIEFREIKRIK